MEVGSEIAHTMDEHRITGPDQLVAAFGIQAGEVTNVYRN